MTDKMSIAISIANLSLAFWVLFLGAIAGLVKFLQDHLGIFYFLLLGGAAVVWICVFLSLR